VASAPAAKTATSPATTVPAQASPAPKAATAKAEEPSDPRLLEIRKGIDRLEADLGKIPNGEGKLSPDDGQLVLNVHEEAQKLLGEVEAVRGDKSKPLSGSLGDSWWDLINLKSRAAKLSRRSPESLAVTNGEGGKQDGAPTTEPAPAP
jgi:hypothetical protein